MDHRRVFWFFLSLVILFRCTFPSIILFSNANGLRLNRHRPSTAWGVQKQFFLQMTEKEYFNSLDGSYHFKYDTGDVKHQMFRSEKRHPDGSVVGFYGYVDPEGILRITEYMAGSFGYKQRTILRYPVQTT